MKCNQPNHSQASYLLDHLHRACKISKRTTVQSVNQVCLFDITIERHQQLWLQVFSDGAAVSDANVSLRLLPFCDILPSHWRATETHMVHAHVLAGRTVAAVVAITCPDSRG